MKHPLTLTLKEAPKQRVDLSSLIPDTLAKKHLKEICAIELVCGNRKIQVGELFDVGGTDTTHIVIKSSCDKLDRIGENMQTGAITVHGDVGAYTGFGMKNGRLTVHGNAGDYTGSVMKKGILQIHGNAGDFLAAAIPGEKYGLTGGTIIVGGNVGDRAGDHMRRGLLLIEGNTGDYCASRMLAGSIAVLGKTGDGTGFGMKRGTLILAQPLATPSATFNDCGTHNLLYLKLLYKSWQKLYSKFSGFSDQIRVRRLIGDLACGGKGEILIWE